MVTAQTPQNSKWLPAPDGRSVPHLRTVILAPRNVETLSAQTDKLADVSSELAFIGTEFAFHRGE
jgi:hypothetical protein